MMKKGNATILASILAIALVAAGVGAGTMAWFSTTAQTTSTYTMNAAEMKMVLTAGPYTFDKLVPGQEFGPIIITIENTGSMDIKYLSGNMVLTSGSVALADKIEIVDWYEYISGYGWVDNLGNDFGGVAQNYEKLVKDELAPLTLLELAQSYVPGNGEPKDVNPGTWYLDQFGKYVKHPDDWITGYGYDQVPSDIPAIKEGGTYYMKLYFRFSDKAGNDLQKTSVSFTITFIGVQDLSQLP